MFAFMWVLISCLKIVYFLFPVQSYNVKMYLFRNEK